MKLHVFEVSWSIRLADYDYDNDHDNEKASHLPSFPGLTRESSVYCHHCNLNCLDARLRGHDGGVRLTFPMTSDD